MPTFIRNAVDELLSSSFMKVPEVEVMNKCINEFIKATSDNALKLGVCMSCTREVFQSELLSIQLDCVPNAKRLHPHTSHPKHKLVKGMLLYTPALTYDDQRNPCTGTICRECLKSLNKDETPKLSLANNMWLGDIPLQLSKLTLPERILIAKYYPTAYIIKLYPKQQGATSWDENHLHRGLRGNVSTYRLDPQQVATVICDSGTSMMPPPAKILSAIIGITFVGPKGLTTKAMPTMFRVRRSAVREALQWLKENNPIYADIEISEERLQELPENDIPDELLSIARFSEDIGAVYREQDGYVPSQEEEGVYTM